ncbi:MAG: hypothetical protein AAF960_20360 [Bacteroidota bacterium]
MKNQPTPILRQPTDGRSYKIGAKENTEVIFKADGDEVRCTPKLNRNRLRIRSYVEKINAEN